MPLQAKSNLTHNQTTLRMGEIVFFRTTEEIAEGQILHIMKEPELRLLERIDLMKKGILLSNQSWCGLQFPWDTRIWTTTVLIDIAKRPRHPPLLPNFKGPWIELKFEKGRACDRCLRALEKHKRDEI